MQHKPRRQVNNTECLNQSLRHKFNRPQNILQRPARTPRDYLRPNLLGNGVFLSQKRPIRTRVGLDPFEVLDLAPAVFVIFADVVESLGLLVLARIIQCIWSLHMHGVFRKSGY